MMAVSRIYNFPFVLSLSKDCPFVRFEEGQGFDRLSPNGFGVAVL